jgi:hypothetical protein
MPEMVEVGTLRVVDGRSVGMRTMNADLLARIGARMSELQLNEAAKACAWWLDTTKHKPSKSAAEIALREIDKAKPYGDRDAIYLESAKFCAQAIIER